MSSQPIPYFTPEQYLEMESTAGFRSEYLFGEIVPMESGTGAHALIVANVIRALGNRVESGGCQVYGSSLLICTDAKSSYVYPDVTIVCGKLEYAEKPKQSVTNPALIVEVLSPSTANYDLGMKARMYWKLPTLTGILFVDQDKVWVEQWSRQVEGAWERRTVESVDDVLNIALLNSGVPVSAIYAGVESTR